MAGLDNIKRFQSGGTTTDVEETPVEKTTTTAVGKAPAATGPYALPRPVGNVGVDPDLLENMRQIIAEREAKKGSFMEGLRDATAWWSGGAAGPGEALRARAAEREGQEATTFGMKSQLAQYKVAQQQAQNLDKALFGAGTGQAATPSAATAPGQAAQPGAAAPALIGSGGLLSLVKDEPLRQSIATQATTGNREGAMKAIQTYLAKNAEDPQMVKELRYMINNGLIDPKLIPAAVLTKFVGSGAFNLQDVRGVGGTSQGTPLSLAQGVNQGAPGPAMQPKPVAPAPAPAMQPKPVAPAPAMQPKPVAPAPAAPAPAAPAPAAPAVQPRPAPAPSVQTPVNTPAEAQPLVSPALKTGFAPGSKEDLDAKAEAAKQAIANRAEQEKPIQKGAGESAVQLTSSAGNAKNNITEYDMAENILKKYPKAFGIAQDGSATAAVIQLVKPGTTIPILGTVKSEGIEEAVAQRSLPKKAIEARNIFNAIATRQGVEFAKNNLTGEGRGTLSNADMKMAQVAKGLSTDSPAAANLIFTVLNRENEMMILKRAEDWKKYQADARAQGFQADFNRFKETPEYSKAMEEKDARVRKRFPEFFKAEEAEPSGKKSAKDFFR